MHCSAVELHVMSSCYRRTIVFGDERMLNIARIEFYLSLDVTFGNGFGWRSVHVGIDSFASFVSIVINVRAGILENYMRMLTLETVTLGIVSELPVLVGMVIVNHVFLDEC